MYCNFTKSQAFPLAFRVSSQPICFKPFQTSKPQYFPVGSHPKTPIWLSFKSPIYASVHKTHENSYLSKPIKSPSDSHHKTLETINKPKSRSISTGFRPKHALQSHPSITSRSYSNSYSQKVDEGSGRVRPRKTLPWLASNKAKELKRSEKATATTKTSRSIWEESAEKFLPRNGTYTVENKESRNRSVEMVENRKRGYVERDESVGEEEREDEVVNDPRWDKIKNRFRGIVNVNAGSETPEFRRWNKQENWGRQTWKEATESTVPKMVGEGIYGVGPVLAALSAGRREFYGLYLQEGLDLSGNNRKKKDKKGFEKVLRIVDKLGLSKKEVSKHDLNMVVDNRPHQGLVLDASPLEMVSIRELDPVLIEGEKGPLWMALDEVMDPQNLGAIIRSAYFFGASGVVVCAKNSAPLSGVVSKASAGSLELMELRSCKNMMQFLASSAENGWRVLGGSVSSKAIPLNEVTPGAPTILVLGSEGTGLRPLVERSCTQLIRIPGNIPVDVTAGGVEDVDNGEMDRGCSSEEFRSFLAVESLNVSVAAGVLLHHLIGNNYNKNCHLGDHQTDALE